METVNIGSVPIGIQYDTGCQMSLISKFVLQQLPEESYSVGRSVRLQVLTYAREGQIISTTSVKLNLNGFQLKLFAIEADLNNSSAFISQLRRNGGRAQEVLPHPTLGKSPSNWAVTIPWLSPRKKNVTKEE